MAENLHMSQIKVVWDASVKNHSAVGRSASPLDVLRLNCKGVLKKSFEAWNSETQPMFDEIYDTD